MPTNPTEKVTVDTILDPGFETYLVDATAGAIILTLPTIDGDFISFTIKRIDSVSANIVTIVGQSAELIDGFTTVYLSPRTNFVCTSLGGAWNTTNGNSKGNELHLTFSQIVGTSTPRSYILINNPAFTSLGIFQYKGLQYYGYNPIKFEITFSINSEPTAAVDFSIQLQDITNAEIIATIGPISVSGSTATIMLESTTVFNNVSLAESIIEIDGRINTGTTGVRLHSINLLLN